MSRLEQNQKAVFILTNEYSNLTRIGVSKTPEARRKALETQTGIPFTLYYSTEILNNADQIEQIISEHFKQSYKFGKWYNITAEEAKQYIISIEDTYTILEEIDPAHREIERKGILEINYLPKAFDKVLNNTIGVQGNKYYIHYKEYSFSRYLRFDYKGEAIYYADKLKNLIQPLSTKASTKYVSLLWKKLKH